MNSTIAIGYTYDDVSLIPKYSEISSVQDVSLFTKFARFLPGIRCPIVSSPMNSVTESDMAISLAMNGGVGVLHRYMSITDQVNMIRNVKEALNYITPKSCANVIKLSEGAGLMKVSDILHFFSSKNMNDSGILLIEDVSGKFAGIMTGRDLICAERNSNITDIMTPFDRCIFVRKNNCDRININAVFAENKMISCIPVLDQIDHICGLIYIQDFYSKKKTNYSSLNNQGNLMVGAEVGVDGDYLDRAIQITKVGCDFISVSMGHGHHKKVLDAVKVLKKEIPNVVIIAGNVSTYQGAKDLIDVEVDGIRCGSGLGNVSETGLSIGVGVPPITAIMDVCRAVQDSEKNIPVIADGGIRDASDIIKALACGASAVMVGTLLAGTDASPGSIYQKNGSGNKCKLVRGKMHEGGTVYDLTFKGIDKYVRYTGPLKLTLARICKNLKSGMLVCGCKTIEELKTSNNNKFIRVTTVGRSHFNPTT